jgi:hypothetical protein
MTASRFRVLAPFLAALLILAFSLLGAWAYYASQTAGLSAFVQTGLKTSIARNFAFTLLLKEVLPLYLGAGIFLWLLSLAVGALLDWIWGGQWRRTWTFGAAFGITLAAFAWIHLVLWWRVPTTLWVLPGVQHLPFILGLPLLALLVLVPLGRFAHRQWDRRAWLLVPCWLLLWTLLAHAPLLLGRQVSSVPRGDRPVQALLLGVDGLRPEEAEGQGLKAFSGTRYPHAYTMIPATRLFYSMLWGGDPAQYSIAHVTPSEDEVQGKLRYTLLEAYKAKGLKSRFYIDDGGTIGLTHRTEAILDETAMPAAGWENFVNSNLAVHLPFYASWLDALRIFPSTNPWTSLDTGLRASIERGRGADLVMFHSCLLHQPIFLSREELKDLPRWWTLRPLDLRPIAGLGMVRPQDASNTDPRRDPLLAYRIRVRHLLAAWRPLWEGLERDPDYAQATRVLFSDHGERFYHATPSLRLQGIHGFDLDPWELRIPFLVAGPSFENAEASGKAVGMLELRDALAEKLLNQRPIRPESFGARPFVPVRYHALKTDFLRAEPEGVKYLSLDPKTIIFGSKLMPGGAWIMRYQASLEERQKGVSLAKATGNHLDVYKPLEGGGAHHLVYEGFAIKAIQTIDEATFIKAKREIEAEFLRPSPLTGFK